MYLLAVQACSKGGQWERALSLMVERRTTVAIEAKEKLGGLGWVGLVWVGLGLVGLGRVGLGRAGWRSGCRRDNLGLALFYLYPLVLRCLGPLREPLDY